MTVAVFSSRTSRHVATETSGSSAPAGHDRLSVSVQMRPCMAEFTLEVVSSTSVIDLGQVLGNLHAVSLCPWPAKNR